MSHETLKAELSELDIEMGKILEDAKLNNGGQLSEDAKSRYDKLDAEYDGKFRTFQVTTNEVKRKDGLKTTTTGPSFKQDPIGGFPAGHPALTGFGEGQATHMTLQTGGMASLSGRRFSDMFGGDSKQNSKHGFATLDGFLAAVASKTQHNKLESLSHQLAQSEGIGSKGGFLVPVEFSTELMDASLETEIVRPRADVRPMRSNIKKIAGFTHSDSSGGSLYGGFTAQWVAEAASGTDETAITRQIELVAKKLFIYSLTSNELLADGEDFEAQMRAATISAIGWHLDDAYLNGTGANQPLGVLKDPALVVTTKETGQAASTITYPNLVNMFARMHPASSLNSVWIANQATIPQLLQLSVSIGTGGSHIQPVMSESGGRFTILTRPVVFTEKVPTLGTEGDISLIDFSQYIIGLRREIEMDTSMHVGFQTDQTAFRTIVRSDAQGKWDQAYVPKSGDSQSWCVTLATRA